MEARTILGSASAVALYSVGAGPSFVHSENCGLYGPPEPHLPFGAISGCENWSVTALNDAPTLTFMVLLFIIGAIVSVRFARFTSLSTIVSLALLGATLGAIAGFVYSGINVVSLTRDFDFYLAICVAVGIAAIIGSVERRRLPNTSLERTRER